MDRRDTLSFSHLRDGEKALEMVLKQKWTEIKKECYERLDNVVVKENRVGFDKGAIGTLVENAVLDSFRNNGIDGAPSEKDPDQWSKWLVDFVTDDKHKLVLNSQRCRLAIEVKFGVLSYMRGFYRGSRAQKRYMKMLDENFSLLDEKTGIVGSWFPLLIICYKEYGHRKKHRTGGTYASFKWRMVVKRP